MTFISLIIISVFYAIYLQRLVALRRQGIRVARLGKGEKSGATRTLERVLQITTGVMVVAQYLSALWRVGATECFVVRILGIATALTGVWFFLAAVVSMRTNWRAGIDSTQKTDLVTDGIYRISRNPAFVGFDLFYIGITILYPNPVLIALTLIAILLFHLQILGEERHLRTTFGRPYDDYARRTRRYF